MKKLLKEFSKGIFSKNPVLGLALGLCPALAVSVTVKNGLAMGLAATFVLICSNLIISTFRKLIPQKIRIPCFIVIIATFVTIVELFMKAFWPALDKSLGIFVPLIVVNCIIMGRAEGFASKHNIIKSLFDALGMGLGFTLALMVISAIREVSGAGTFLGVPVLGIVKPALFMIFAPGALLTLGLLIALMNMRDRR